MAGIHQELGSETSTLSWNPNVQSDRLRSHCGIYGCASNLTKGNARSTLWDLNRVAKKRNPKDQVGLSQNWGDPEVELFDFASPRRRLI